MGDLPNWASHPTAHRFQTQLQVYLPNVSTMPWSHPLYYLGNPNLSRVKPCAVIKGSSGWNICIPNEEFLIVICQNSLNIIIVSHITIPCTQLLPETSWCYYRYASIAVSLGDAITWLCQTCDIVIFWDSPLLQAVQVHLLPTGEYWPWRSATCIKYAYMH